MKQTVRVTDNQADQSNVIDDLNQALQNTPSASIRPTWWRTIGQGSLGRAMIGSLTDNPGNGPVDSGPVDNRPMAVQLAAKLPVVDYNDSDAANEYSWTPSNVAESDGPYTPITVTTAGVVIADGLDNASDTHYSLEVPSRQAFTELRNKLQDLLVSAEQSHKEYESQFKAGFKQPGEPEQTWPEYYARFIAGKLGGKQ